MYHSINFIPEADDIYDSSGNLNGKNTWDDWHLIPSERHSMAAPDLKENYIDIPGADGSIDATEAVTRYRPNYNSSIFLSNPVYENRSGSFEFYVKDYTHELFKERVDFTITGFKSRIKNASTFTAYAKGIVAFLNFNIVMNKKALVNGFKICRFSSKYGPVLSIKTKAFNQTKSRSIDVHIRSDGAILIDAKNNNVDSGDVITGKVRWEIIQSVDWIQRYSEIMNYLHGKRMKIILEDEPSYYYLGRVSVNEWKSEKDYSRITLDYNVDPYKYETYTSEEPWLWDPFSFIDGVVRSFETWTNILITDSVTRLYIPLTTYPAIPTFKIYAFAINTRLRIRYYDANNNILKERIFTSRSANITEPHRFYDMKLGKEVNAITLRALDNATFVVSVVYRGGIL